MLPSELERKQIFYWLKRISSYTAWNRILGYYKAWADTVEQSVRIAVDKGWIKETGMPESDLIAILKALSHFEEGVRRLRSGDKRVFKRDANGEFAMGNIQYNYFRELLHRIDTGDMGIDEAHTPLWDEFKHTLNLLGRASDECWPEIIESRWIGDPSRTVYGDYLREHLPKMPFPCPLPDTLEPNNNLLIPTGKNIPCSGIWEPIEAPIKKGFSLFRNEDASHGPFKPAGCMNYLHAGSPAPQASLETTDANPNADVTWRLLWRDDRYEDGTIPAEEASYVFLEPQTVAPVPVAQVVVPSNIHVAKTGQAAPYAGRWLVENDLQASVTLAQGEPLPQHNGRVVRWVLAES
ncbi:hypothetical protein CS053_01035 [Rhodanobacter glycinis]|uniref:Immunity protein 72 n=2 Tax=Rhodanobacter glycinis TaxID=582702 RepID=A0A5B9E6H0_9GAMM|nr:hypothetical protein CS053_01035 [Rhodanobacter glycinis]